MYRTVTVGLDDSPEGRAAVEWAAREAQLRGLPLKIVHVQEPTPRFTARTPLFDSERYHHWAEQLAREAAEHVRLRHPSIEVITEQLTGAVADVLCEAAGFAELMVLGSQRIGGLRGAMAGSVTMGVVAHAERPVVLVRAHEQTADEHGAISGGVPPPVEPYRPVVVGLDLGRPDEALLGFAFDAAARRGTALRAVHAWPEVSRSVHGFSSDAAFHDTLERGEASMLRKVLRPWRQKFPDVEVIEASRCGNVAQVLVHNSRDACLVVVGRRIRTGSLGTHIGPVTHSALHHIAAPVAVVAHA
ncbi:universal stress protein [Streptomyces longwoodensis]|uniref:universal stress protein n=1 Tax=Streptomyces longwoodensis TaxID=68231 RepID=UPI0036F822B3